MVEIHTGVWVGDENDYLNTVMRQDGWAVVHACKEPYHRQALGYTGRGAPKNHPEYLVARRDKRLILNLVDVDDPAFIRREIVDAAVAFIDERLQAGQTVLVHCNQGRSRGPTIGFLYLVAHTDRLSTLSYDDAVADFRRIYPPFQPARGMAVFSKIEFDSYRSRRRTPNT